MSKPPLWLVVVAAGVPLLLVLLGAVATWVWVTIPPEPDPGALPSRVLEPPSAAYGDAVEEGRSIARSFVAEEKLPGLSLAVAVDGEIVWAEGFRWADLENQTPVTPETLFRIGGVSETLTAAAVGLLSERGRLDLDAPVQRYVPSFPEKEWPISTRQLMAHMAGIRPHYGGEEIIPQTSCANDAERLAIFAGAPLRFRPGTEHLYSTWGFVLVGAVVAAAANEPYLDFMQREILAPLGMDGTIPDAAGQTEPGSAHFYFPRLMLDPRYGLHDAPVEDLPCILPAGGFLSTPSDLVRFGAAMMGDALLDPATVAELQTPVPLASGESTGRALGWDVRSVPMGADGAPTRIVGQGLGDPVRRTLLSAQNVGARVSGGTTSLLTVPEHRIAVAVATNTSGAKNVSLLAARLADVFIRLLEAAAATSPANPPSTTTPAETHQGFLYGRITTVDGATYEGRLRWGGGEEAFWGDYFNGSKHENPWLAQVPPEGLPKKRRPIQIFGLKIADRETPNNVVRLFMARFGEIARIEAEGVKVVRVTLKSGTVFDLDRFEAGDFDDGVRVWDGRRGVVDLDSLRIRTIELLPTPSLGDAPSRLHGTVRTRQGDFTGFVQWNREKCVGTDELDGRSADGDLSLRFDTIRSIARRSDDSSLVTLRDGREIVLSGAHEMGDGNRRGLYVDDGRYGRVLISWDAFERVDFSPGGSGPAYGDFPPGRPLTGSVTTRDGRRLAGRLVYDLDESEITETLDAPSQGVDYTIPFGLIASIVAPGREERGAQRGRVTLHDGEEVQLERTGDLGEGNAGMLIFVDGRQRPEYVPWTDVAQVDFDRPPAMVPPHGGR